MRLSDDLAARRRLYAMPLVTAPAVMVIDIPPHLAGQGLALDRYYTRDGKIIDYAAQGHVGVIAC